MLITETDAGESPLSTSDAAAFLKVASGVDDTAIASMVEVATLYCEEISGRSVRDHTFQQLMTGFDSMIWIYWADVASVSKIEHRVSGAWVTVDATVYQLSRQILTSCILVRTGQGWPTNTDDEVENVRVTFKTSALRQLVTAIGGIQRHLALLYADRGDMEGPSSRTDPGMMGTSANIADTARQSGAVGMYQTFSAPGI